MDTFDFFKTTMPSTRKADFYLGCLDSSVYMDFDKLENGQIALIRISFDGFGCCSLKSQSKPLDKELSKLFRQEMSKEVLNQALIELIVKEAILLNKESIWSDALERYQLI